MNPAFSVIFFTSSSGAGYGLWFLLGMAALLAPAALNKTEGLIALALGFVLVSLGLLSSFLHLGHPERAWRAFSQWRSSWLSREGVASVVCYVPAMGLGLCLLYANTGIGMRLFGAWLALGAWITVYCTARIYTSLKTVRAWHNAYVLPGYLLIGLMNGALWLWAISAGFGATLSYLGALSQLLLIGLALSSKWMYWRFIATAKPVSSIATATGLGHLGSVKSFAAPHTEENYLLREMGFVLGRKHAAALRRWSIALAFFAPATLLCLALLLPALNPLLAIFAASLASVGVVVERWLFFAQARHVVTLYYGA